MIITPLPIAPSLQQIQSASLVESNNSSSKKNKEQKVMNVSWDDYYQTAEKLATIIQESDWPFDHIVCIARGGMPIGDMLSRFFNKPLAVIIASSYRGENGTQQNQLHFSEVSKISDLSKNVLLVDDLADSGKTLQEIKKHIQEKHKDIQEIRTAVLWVKTSSSFLPNYFSESVNGGTWINQPFERRYSLKTADKCPKK